MTDFLKNYDAITDTQLRSCVKLLGKLLGNAIKAHAGNEVYNAVEKLRKGFINLHKHPPLLRRNNGHISNICFTIPILHNH